MYMADKGKHPGGVAPAGVLGAGPYLLESGRCTSQFLPLQTTCFAGQGTPGGEHDVPGSPAMTWLCLLRAGKLSPRVPRQQFEKGTIMLLPICGN